MTLTEALRSAFIERRKAANAENNGLDYDQDRVYERGINAFRRFDSFHVENGLGKLFKGYTPEQLFNVTINDREPSKEDKSLYIESKDFDTLVRFAAYVGGAKQANKVKGLRQYKTILPIPLSTFINAAVDELRVYDRTNCNIYCGRLIGAKFHIEDVRDILYSAGYNSSSVNSDASSVKTILRFCGLITIAAYDRDEVMTISPESVRMLRAAVLNHKAK